MNNRVTRLCLIAAYCFMSWRMAVELISHPAAKDHASSILGLGFVLLVPIALFLTSLRLVPIAGMSGPLLGSCDQARRRAQPPLRQRQQSEQQQGIERPAATTAGSGRLSRNRLRNVDLGSRRYR